MDSAAALAPVLRTRKSFFAISLPRVGSSSDFFAGDASDQVSESSAEAFRFLSDGELTSRVSVGPFARRLAKAGSRRALRQS